MAVTEAVEKAKVHYFLDLDKIAAEKNMTATMPSVLTSWMMT